MTRLVALLLVILGAAVQPDTDAMGVRGGVANHEGTPLTEGTVTLQSIDLRSIVTASLDQSGRFRIVPSVAGRHRLTIAVPGYAPRLADVVVPASRTITLPALLLEPPAYFRARFVTSDGEVIASPLVRRRTAGPDGITFPGTDAVPRVDSDGTVAIGPLSMGMTSMVLDMPGLAQTRLPDLTVRNEHSVRDGGTIVIERGTVLTVAIVDGTGAPVANHQVTVEDVRPNSPVPGRTARTNQQGRATFDRLGAGRYRVSAPMIEGCNGRVTPLPTGQVVPVNGTGEAGARIVIAGQAGVRITAQGAPLTGAVVSVSPDAGNENIARTITIPGKPPIPMTAPFCTGSSDGDGRATFTNMPRGAARLSVRLHNSTFERLVELRGDGREIPIEIPGGAIQLRAIDASTGRPVPRAAVTWLGDGYKVLATATGSGDVLLEGVSDSPGVITVTASGFRETKVETPASPAPLEVALTPAPSSDRRVRVVADTGEPIAQAIVLLTPATVFDVGVYAATDSSGTVRFANVPPGIARVVAQADGFVGAAFNLDSNSDRPTTLTLARRQ